MTNALDFFRPMKKLRLATAFFVATSAFHVPSTETLQVAEFRALMTAYTEKGPAIGDKKFERLQELMSLMADNKEGRNIMAGAGFCAHGSAGGGSGGGSGGSGGAPSGGTGACPCPTDPRKRRDASHLLAIDDLSYYM